MKAYDVSGVLKTVCCKIKILRTLHEIRCRVRASMRAIFCLREYFNRIFFCLLFNDIMEVSRRTGGVTYEFHSETI